jgi:hypothetical protein
LQYSDLANLMSAEEVIGNGMCSHVTPDKASRTLQLSGFR